MQPKKRHRKFQLNQANLTGLFMFCLLAFFSFPNGFGCTAHAGKHEGSFLQTGVYDHQASPGLTVAKKFSSHLIQDASPHVIKSKTSQPLSRQNYKKTRPRGIPAQQPGSKDFLSAGLLIMFPPALSIAICTTKYQALTTASGCAERIRPPPSIRKS
jgi:hypothetical protein